MTTFAQYLAVIMLHEAEQLEDEAYSGSFKTLSERLTKSLNGVEVNPHEVKEALEILRDFAGAKIYADPLTSGYWHVNYDNFRYYFIQDQPDFNDNDKEEYRRLKEEITTAYPILVTYAEIGRQFALDTIYHLQTTESNEWSELRRDAPPKMIPASDRVVQIGHNHITELASATDAVIKGVEGQNSIDGNFNLQAIILGQLKAGRELILSGCVRLHVLQITLIDTLIWLSKRYEKEAIGSAASVLLAALAKRLGIDI